MFPIFLALVLSTNRMFSALGFRSGVPQREPIILTTMLQPPRPKLMITPSLSFSLFPLNWFSVMAKQSQQKQNERHERNDKQKTLEPMTYFIFIMCHRCFTSYSKAAAGLPLLAFGPQLACRC